MKTTVRVGQRVKDFIGTLAPEPRQRLRRALRDLERSAAAGEPLEGELAPYYRLRVGRMRVVYAEKAEGGRRLILCFYANWRPVVYDLLQQLLADDLIEELRDL